MKKAKAMMQTAQVWAEESYCKRNKVGAVLAKDDRVLVTGYNGTIRGHENDCEDGDITKLTVVHAEQNVIAFAAKNGIPTEGCTMFVTLSPCDQCAKLLVQAGISEIVYMNEYRDKKGIEILRKSGVEVRQFD